MRRTVGSTRACFAPRCRLVSSLPSTVNNMNSVELYEPHIPSTARNFVPSSSKDNSRVSLPSRVSYHLHGFTQSCIFWFSRLPRSTLDGHTRTTQDTRSTVSFVVVRTVHLWVHQLVFLQRATPKPRGLVEATWIVVRISTRTESARRMAATAAPPRTRAPVTSGGGTAPASGKFWRSTATRCPSPCLIWNRSRCRQFWIFSFPKSSVRWRPRAPDCTARWKTTRRAPSTASSKRTNRTAPSSGALTTSCGGCHWIPRTGACWRRRTTRRRRKRRPGPRNIPTDSATGPPSARPCADWACRTCPCAAPLPFRPTRSGSPSPKPAGAMARTPLSRSGTRRPGKSCCGCRWTAPGRTFTRKLTLFLLDDRLIFCCCSHIRVWRLGKGAGALLLQYNLPPHAADPNLPKFVYCEGFVLCVTDQDSVDAYQIMESERHFPNVLGTTLPNIMDMFVVNSHWLIVHGTSHHRTYSQSDVYQFDLRGSPWLVDQPLPYYRHHSGYGVYEFVAPCPGVLLDGVIAYSVCETGYLIVKIFQIHDSSHSTGSWRKHGWFHLEASEPVINNSCGRQILCPDSWTPYCRTHRLLDGRLERILECPGGITHEGVMAHVGAKNDILLVGMNTSHEGRRFPHDGGLPLALFSARNSCT